MKALFLALLTVAALAGAAGAQYRPQNCQTTCEPDGWGGQRCVTRCY
jgi:hypothetical protein